MESKKKTLLADIGLFYAAAIWGSTFFLVKNSLSNIDPVTLVAYRFLLATALMLPFVFRKKVFQNFKNGFFLGFLLWLLYVPQTLGLKYTTASNSGFITGLFVVFVPIFSFFMFKKNVSRQKTISVIVAALGLWFLTGGLKTLNLGDLLTLIAAVTYALHIIFADKYMKDSDPYVLNFQQILTVGVLSFITAILFRLPLNIGNTLPIILFLTLFPTLSAFLIQLIAQKFTSAIKVAMIFSLEPVFAAIFAWTIGGEKFIFTSAIGGLLIVIAMVISEIPIKNGTK